MKADNWPIYYTRECAAIGGDRLELSPAARARREAEQRERTEAERRQRRLVRRLRWQRRLQWLRSRRQFVRGMVVGVAVGMLLASLLPTRLANVALIGAVLSGIGACVLYGDDDKN